MYNYFKDKLNIKIKAIRKELLKTKKEIAYLYDCISENKDTLLSYNRLMDNLTKYDEQENSSYLMAINEIKKPPVVSSYINRLKDLIKKETSLERMEIG